MPLVSESGHVRKEADEKRASRRCGQCRAAVVIYDLDYALDCYLGPRRIDPTPLSIEQAIACRIIGRDLYLAELGVTGRRRLSRIWEHRPLPVGIILPAHICGARVPTAMPDPTQRHPVPEHCPF